MKWFRSIPLVILMLLIASVAVAGSGEAKAKTSNLAILTTTLSLLDLAHPEQDMANHVAHGDYRFIGMNGYSCTAPGIRGTPSEIIDKYGIWCLEGTSDMIEGEEHMKLIKKAKSYAERYNIALAKWLANHEEY
jgi:outer membrane lipoprotein LolB